LLFVAGCQKAERGDFVVEDLGFSMSLPEGWAQGEPLAAGGFRKTSKGLSFFDTVPRWEEACWGFIEDVPMEGLSFEELIEKEKKEKEESERALDRIMEMIPGRAKETGGVNEDYQEISEEFTLGEYEVWRTLTAWEDRFFADHYIHHPDADRVVFLHLECPKKSFDEFKPLYEEMIGTIELKP